MLEALGTQQPATRTQILDQVRVGVLHPPSDVGADALIEGPVQPHRVDDVESMLLAQAEVILAEGDRGVHQPGAIARGDEVAR